MARQVPHRYRCLGVTVGVLILLIVLFIFHRDSENAVSFYGNRDSPVISTTTSDTFNIRGDGNHNSSVNTMTTTTSDTFNIRGDGNHESPVNTMTTTTSDTINIRGGGNHDSPVYTVTTGASSKEFLGLLHLVETLATDHPKLKLVIWNLGLRKCQVEFLEKKMPRMIKVQIRDFPFLQYPPYFRSIKGIWKPVAIKKVFDEDGAALWLDPEIQLKTSLKNIFGSIELHEIVALETNPTTALVGFQNKSYNILKKWEEETQKITPNKCKYSSVIAKASCGKATVSWPDFTFKKLILQSGQKCSYLDFESQLYTKAQTLLQKYYLSQQEKICKQDSVCILSGDQYYRRPGQDLTSIGLQLLQNKKGYCLAHGYRYINIGGMYTERKNSGKSSRHTDCNWAKFDGMLEYSQECQLVLFLDTDAIFTNFSMKVETLFDLFQAKDKQMFINVPSLDGYINAGAILMRNSNDARSLLLAAMDEQQWSKNWRTTWGFEQSAMWELIRPPNSRRRSIIHISEDDHTLQGLCGFSKGRCLWKPGDFIIHFAPPPNKAKEIAKFIKDHPKLFIPPKTKLLL